MANLAGITVIDKIVPTSDQDTYPTHEDIYGRGGLMTVANVNERDSIPEPRRKIGMMVRTNADQKVWILDGGITNLNWKELLNVNSLILTDTSITLLNDFNSKVLYINTSSICTVNIPQALTIGFNVALVQMGNGAIKLQPATGVTLRQRLGLTQTAGRYGIISLLHFQNNEFILYGDLG